MASIRVLMVDDQPVILAALKQMLADETEFELRAVADPSEAVQQALAFAPSVILQDLVMDGIDGIALLKRYRAHPNLSDVPMVMLSAAEEPATKVEAFRCGANDYVVKLPSALELAARLRYHGRAFHNARQREHAFQALLESRAALEAHQAEIERQKEQLEAQARQLEEVNRELADSALSDALTGLRNRRFLRVYLDHNGNDATPARADDRRRTGDTTILTYFMFDLDHFKQVNDRHGHDVGDSVLIEIARRLRQTVRRHDAALRWGGEEFLLVARGLSDDGAVAMAQRILQAIAGQPIAIGQRQPLWMSASLGYTRWPWVSAPERFQGASDYQWPVGLADAAAYLAKLAGRNRAYGVLPGPDPGFAQRLADINLEPGTLRREDGAGVELRELPGPAQIQS